MNKFYYLILISIVVLGCESENTSNSGENLRVNSTQFALALTHNSHLGIAYSSLESAYSATINFEVFLNEATNHENIYAFQIVDENGEGWSFSNSEIIASYNEDNHSLIFQDLNLRIYDDIREKLLLSEIVDENEEVVFSRGFTLDNDFPLPARMTFQEESNTLYLDFYTTPYDGGTLPFPVTFYSTMYSSGAFILRWTNEQNEILREDYLGFNSFTESETPNDWIFAIDPNNIPAGATSFYFAILRGWFTSGGILYANIEEIPVELRQ